MFRGREVTHPERGTALLDRLAEELGEIAVIEQTPLQDGRNMTMMLGPSKSVLSGEAEGSKPPADDAKPAKDAAEPPEDDAQASRRTPSSLPGRRGASLRPQPRGEEAGHQNGAAEPEASPTPSDAAA